MPRQILFGPKRLIYRSAFPGRQDYLSRNYAARIGAYPQRRRFQNIFHDITLACISYNHSNPIYTSFVLVLDERPLVLCCYNTSRQYFLDGVVMLSGLAVLRAREYYADIRASAWDQTSQIDRALATLPARIDEGWRGYFRFHPGAGERRRIVGDPSGLFRLSFADAFGVGIAAWSIVEVLSFMATPFWPQGKWASLVFFWSIKVGIPAVVFVFAVGVIGIGVWRGAFASILKGDPPSKGAG